MSNIYDIPHETYYKNNDIFVCINNEEIRCKDFPNEFKDHYFILENGMVFSKFTKKIRRQHVSRDKGVEKYFQIVVSTPFTRATLNTHRLVALAFVENHTGLDFCDIEVNHIDCNKQNNHYTNLETEISPSHSI